MSELLPKKNCSQCVYNDGRYTGSMMYKCCTPTRQKNLDIEDCMIPVEPLRKIQEQVIKNVRATDVAERYANATMTYIIGAKAKSRYWSKEYKKEQ